MRRFHRCPHQHGWHRLPASAVRRLAGRNGCNAVLTQARWNKITSPSIPPGQWPAGTGEPPVPPADYEISGLAVMPFGNSSSTTEPNAKGGLPFPYPNGIVSRSPGLRRRSYPGSRVRGFQPQRGCVIEASRRHNPVGVGAIRPIIPRVAPLSQPWAWSRNPFRILSENIRKALGSAVEQVHPPHHPKAPGDWRTPRPGGLPSGFDHREASWTAPALWRFPTAWPGRGRPRPRVCTNRWRIHALPPERRSPTRRGWMRSSKRAESEISAPQLRHSRKRFQGCAHEPAQPLILT
jgi:hypothetical protein